MNALLLALLAAGPPAAASAEAAVRAELDGLQAAVEASVARVSRPAGLLVGRQAGRSYLLRGYGAMVVLAPRHLPRAARRAADVEARVVADLVDSMEERLRSTRDPQERRRLASAVEAVRRGGTAPAPPKLDVRVPRPPHAPRPSDLHALQEQAEAFRREAEQAMERAEREVRIQLRLPEGEPFVWVPPAPPAPPDAVVPPSPPRAPAAPRAHPAPHVRGPALPATGFRFWFGEPESGDDAPPERVLADVRAAIVEGLGAHRGDLALLGGDDFVAVAVDFVPWMAERGSARTVVARVKRSDLAAARTGRISRAELRARVAFDEY